MPPVTSTELRAEDIRWDLTDLCSGAEEARAEWTALVERAQELASRYRGKIAALDAARFRALLDETDDLEQELSRLQVYSYLRLSMAATEVEANDLATFSRDRAAEIENALEDHPEGVALRIFVEASSEALDGLSPLSTPVLGQPSPVPGAGAAALVLAG